MNSKTINNEQIITLNNPFTKAQNGLIRLKKKSIIKYVAYVFLVILLLTCMIIIISRSSKIEAMRKEHRNIGEQMANFTKSINQLLIGIKSEEQNKEKNSLFTKEFNVLNNEFAVKRRALHSKANNKTFESEIETIKKQIQLETITNNRLNQENKDIEMHKTKLQKLLNEYKKQIDSLKDQHTVLQKQLENKKQEENKNEIIQISQIINSLHYDTLNAWFNFENNYKLVLLYSKSQIPFTPNNFHFHVDDWSNTIVILSSIQNNIIIGGYTSQKWKDEGFKKDSNAFLFDLVKAIKYPVNKEELAIYCNHKYYPLFGNGDLTILQDTIKSDFPNTYGNYYHEKLILTNGKPTFTFDYLEVYSLTKIK